MSRSSLCTGFLCLGLVMISVPLAAQHPQKGKGPKGKVVVVHAQTHRFRDNDRVAIRNYYSTHHIVVSPLRPEVARLVVVGRPLPPGIAKRALSRDVIVLVPPPAPRYSYAIVGNRVVLLDDRGFVADILDGIFP